MNKMESITDILKQKMGIESLNSMQKRVLDISARYKNLTLFAPTGSGKTLAYTLVLLHDLSDRLGLTQAVIVAPSRELVLQIGQVVKTLAVGRKVTCLYGGHQAKEERQSLSVAPDVVVATPGRLLDHLTHERLDLSKIALVVLDEFDKILELGFEETMRQVMGFMPGTARRILTSATPMTNEVPAFVKMDGAALLDCRGVDGPAARMEKWMVGEEKGLKKTELLLKLLTFCGGKTMVFANTIETALNLAA
ncbi:MAG: DEAD/DEAH box helicase, partial [Muribaculaceae bacterium]|nr:DEAD/DEAH box helicase [Muribaculaceae bacterium]